MQLRQVGTNALDVDGASTAKELEQTRAVEARRRSATAPAPVPAGGGVLRRYRHIAVGLALSDALCVVVALVASYALRYPGVLVPAPEVAVLAVGPLLWIAVFSTFDLYTPHHLSAPEELRRVIGASGVGIMLLVLVSFWSKSSFSRAWVGLTWVLVLVLELLARRLWRAYQWRLRIDGRLALRTLVVGTSAEAGRLVEILQAPTRGFCRSDRYGLPARPSPRTGCRSWAGSATSIASSGIMPPTASSSPPQGSPRPSSPGSRRWHARRRSRSGCWPTSRRC